MTPLPLALAFLLASPLSACASFSGGDSAASRDVVVFSGKVVAVIDGDFIRVMDQGVAEEIRLQGIDCPEKGQAFGQAAKEATSGLVFGEHVTVETYGRGRYGRTLGDIILPDGRVLNHELVREGFCWWFKKYAPKDSTLKALEAAAREAKRGLWSEPNPVPPWVFRKSRNSEPVDLAEAPVTGVEESAKKKPRGPPSPKDKDINAAPSEAGKLPILGNSRSRIYHHPHCPNYPAMPGTHWIPFKTEAEAEAAGYRGAKNCR